MYRNFVPLNLQNEASEFIADLNKLSEKPTNCPYCNHNKLYSVNSSSGYYRCQQCKKSFTRSVNTPFFRLAPLEWLSIIAERRLCGQNYASIRYELDCTSWMIKRRVNIIDSYMQKNYESLYEWYQNFIHSPKESVVPKMVAEQAEALKNWVQEQLNSETATCSHCQSTKTQKVNESRAQFRCKSCWKYFSNLKGTGLEHLSRSENWLTMIDMFVAQQPYQEIQKKLNISSSTITHNRRCWLKIIENRNLLVLKEWLATSKK